MTKEQMALYLDGRQYRDEMSKEDHKTAKDSGLVVVFGASDDLMEFRGCIYDEAGCYEGGEIIFTKDGKFPDEEAMEVLKEYDACRKLNKITAVWCPEIEGNPSWAYETSIKHSTFKIYEDEQLYCIGIVFNHSNLS